MDLFANYKRKQNNISQISYAIYYAYHSTLQLKAMEYFDVVFRYYY